MDKEKFRSLPRSIKKATRYILQDATEEKLILIKEIMEQAIKQRENIIQSKKKSK
jgi:hypothetical protein